MKICFGRMNCFCLAVALLPAVALRAAGPTTRSVVRPDARTGRLVRGVDSAVPKEKRANGERQPATSSPASSLDLSRAVEEVAREQNLPSGLIHSVIQAESNYDPYAVSPKGALGLMQLIPATARRFGVKDAFDPLDNLQGGARYLKYLLELYQSYPLALAAYNAGEGAVARHGGIPPYPETLAYVARVRKNWSQTVAPLQTAETRAAQGETKHQPAYNPIREVMDADGVIYYVAR